MPLAALTNQAREESPPRPSAPYDLQNHIYIIRQFNSSSYRLIIRKFELNHTVAYQLYIKKWVLKHQPEVRKPVTARPMSSAAGTRTGLKRRKTGMRRPKPITLAARARPERVRRMPPVGKSVATAMACDLEGPLSGMTLFTLSVTVPGVWRCCARSAISLFFVWVSENETRIEWMSDGRGSEGLKNDREERDLVTRGEVKGRVDVVVDSSSAAWVRGQVAWCIKCMVLYSVHGGGVLGLVSGGICSFFSFVNKKYITFLISFETNKKLKLIRHYNMVFMKYNYIIK
jgi:hypothetical protein